MRFEIRAGGAFLILLALGGLSAAVFALGLIAGYEMAGQDQSSRPIVAVYPLPKPPPLEASALPQAEAAPPAAAGAPASAASSSPALAGLSAAPVAVPAPVPKPGSPPPAAALPPAPAKVASAPPLAATAPRPASKAAAEPLRAAAALSRSEAAAEAGMEAPEVELKTAAARAPRTKRKPYNIQIEAVMDKRGAEDMIKRLRSLGYLPYIVETDIDGQTWYRVRVGPYESEAEARAAEAKLHERYSGAFTTR